MAFTRLGYLVIISIIAIAAGAVAVVVWPHVSSDSSSASGDPTPVTADLPSIEFAQVVALVKYGAVSNIETQGQTMTVYFRPDLDTRGLPANAHIFRCTLAPGEDAVTKLRAAGAKVNGADGVPVVAR